MAGRKRRKPDRVAGLIADAISDRQKAQAQTQRLEARAQLAWAKENAKIATANAREKARQEQREAREREIAKGHAEAETVTRTLQGHLIELRTPLTGTLDEDPYLSWDRFKVPLLVAELEPPQRLATESPPPQASDFMPEPPTGLGALAPGRRRAYISVARPLVVSNGRDRNVLNGSDKWWPSRAARSATAPSRTGAAISARF